MPAPIKAELVAHSSEWGNLAREEITRLAAALGPNVVAIHHIGSTAVPGICAKPILDLMPQVSALVELDAARPIFERLRYEWWGEYGIAGRRYCTLNDSATGRRMVQMHCFETGNTEIERHLAFRDYLRSQPEVAAAYDREKRRCRDLHPDDSHAYTDAKCAWIESVMPLALSDYRRKLQTSAVRERSDFT
ncbi:MAG TPA: GrpB family protein [Candidatus Dormibacteraeota bacterium]|nr:GrpB family protein [Candidatus Dormibacteraeota bacterium]